MTDITRTITDISENWKMIDAQYRYDSEDHKAGETRTDGHYPIWIGATYSHLVFIGPGKTVIMPCVKSNNGSEGHGYITTSCLCDVSLPKVLDNGKTRFQFATLNTIYTMESAD